MDREQLTLVRQSWGKMQEIGPPAATLFYQHLFNQNPDLRELFHGDMEQQGWKLLQMLGLSVAALDEPDTLQPLLRALARRHVGYGVRAALMNTLRDGLGEEFTPQHRVAWDQAYGYIASVMTSAVSGR